MNDKRIVETERSISQAFMDLLGEKGYERVETCEIAARAGVSKSTFYNHYSGKADLASRLAADAVARYAGMVEDRFDDVSEKRFPLLFLESRASAMAEVLPVLVRLRTVKVGGVTVEDQVRAVLADSYVRYVRRRKLEVDDVELQSELYAATALEYAALLATRYGEPVGIDALERNFRQLSDVVIGSLVGSGHR